MAQITPQMVKELREKTGAGMGDCKKALTQTEGNMQEAIDFLRKKGAASAAKRSERSANEGIVFVSTTADGKKAAIVEINCETDFVAMNEDFITYANQIGKAVIENSPANPEELMKTSVDGETVENLHNGILAKFSEKIEVNRFETISTEGYVSAYSHMGSKLGVLIEVSENGLCDDSKTLVHDIAMQVAAMNPPFVNKDQVDTTTMEKEKDIYIQQAIGSGKPAEIAERIAEGRMGKFFTENCLVDMAFVKDPKKKVSDIVKEITAKVGKEVNVISFKRFSIGG